VPKLPPYPAADDLIEFVVSAADTFRFFIDRKSISVEQGGVVRYTVVARSPAGAETVNYEGIRCKPGLYRVYATGRNDRTWNLRASAEWREIPLKVANRWYQSLRREFFCPQNTPIFDAAEGVDALRRGGHPNKAFDAGNIR
jgi:hypothetical protein